MELGTLIRIARKNGNISIRELANKANLSPRTVYHVEDNTGKPTFEVVAKMCKVLRIDLNQLARMTVFGEDK